MSQSDLIQKHYATEGLSSRLDHALLLSGWRKARLPGRSFRWPISFMRGDWKPARNSLSRLERRREIASLTSAQASAGLPGFSMPCTAVM